MNKELYHGTTFRRIGNVWDGREDLFGVRYPNDPAHSATLTDDKGYAQNCATGTYMNDGMMGHRAMVVFSIPEEELVSEGPVQGHETILGFSTTLLVTDPQTLPEDFLQHLGITVEDAIRDYTTNKKEFYRIPRTYMTAIDALD